MADGIQMNEESELRNKVELAGQAIAKLIKEKDVLKTDVENLMSAMEHLTATVEMILPRISELQMWRDTGAIHRQCKVCDQLVAVTAYNHLTPHGRPEWGSGWCPNSGNVAS